MEGIEHLGDGEEGLLIPLVYFMNREYIIFLLEEVDCGEVNQEERRDSQSFVTTEIDNKLIGTWCYFFHTF